MKAPAVGLMTERASYVATLNSARRRRERKLRSMWRHEIASIKMAVLCATHHSPQRCAHAQVGVPWTHDFGYMVKKVPSHLRADPICWKRAMVVWVPVHQRITVIINSFGIPIQLITLCVRRCFEWKWFDSVDVIVSASIGYACAWLFDCA